MLISDLQQRISKQILIGYGFLILLTIILHAFSNFLIDDELTSILTTLASISALYVAPLFRFFSRGLRGEEKSPPSEINETFFIKLINLVIPAHFVIVGILIFIKSINIISFKEMNLFLGFIETTFGAYMSFVIISLFNLNET